MTLTTAVELGVWRPLKAGLRWAAGAVLLVGTHAQDLVWARALQASCEGAIRPSHFVPVDLEAVANFFHGDLLGEGEMGA